MSFKETDLRKEAENRACKIRIPGVCNGDRETVVLCHLHKPSIDGGLGLKATDKLGAHGCVACHDVVDGRAVCGYLKDQVTEMFYEGIFRTQALLIKEGKL